MAILPMRKKRIQRLAVLVCNAMLMLSMSGIAWATTSHDDEAGTPAQAAGQRAPILGADLFFANDFSPLIAAWQDKQQGDEMAAALAQAGLRSLRFSSHGYYSASSAQATESVK